MEMTNLDHFTGGVPAKVIFEMNIEDLNQIIESCSEQERVQKKALEICFIGLISYFEAFMKENFASIIKICPELLKVLSKNGQDVGINSADLLLLENNHINRVGFLISEKYDFGTANKINSLYMALLMVSPFSKEEKQVFDRLLNDRNLLVHHGGIYSLSYSKQKHTELNVSTDTYYNSLIIDHSKFKDALETIKVIINKTTEATHTKLSEYIDQNKIHLSEERQKALDALVWSL